MEALPGLPDGLWPIHLQPKPDELLSSWVVRVAHAHRIKVETFCATLFGREPAIWNRDIDKLAPKLILDGLARATGCRADTVFSTTLRAYAGVLAEKVSPYGDSRWLIPLGVFHRSRRKPALMYCPLCLRAANSAYFRRLWRVAWATVCTQHRCFLFDTCSVCDAPVVPHRTDMAARTLMPWSGTRISCYHCGTSLAARDAAIAPNYVIQWQLRFEQALQRGYLTWAGNCSLRSFLFFDGVRALSAGLVRVDRRDGRQKAKVASVEHMSLDQRREHIWEVMMLLEHWPEHFENYIHDERLRCSEFEAFGEGMPYWYWAELRQLVEKRVGDGSRYRCHRRT